MVVAIIEERLKANEEKGSLRDLLHTISVLCLRFTMASTSEPSAVQLNDTMADNLTVVATPSVRPRLGRGTLARAIPKPKEGVPLGIFAKALNKATRLIANSNQCRFVLGANDNSNCRHFINETSRRRTRGFATRKYFIFWPVSKSELANSYERRDPKRLGQTGVSQPKQNKGQ